MATFSATYLYHKHAKVCDELGEKDKALASYKMALKKPIAAIIEAAETGKSDYRDIDGTVVEDFSRFCEAQEYAGELASIRDTLCHARNIEAIPNSLKHKIDRLLLRLIDCSGDIQHAQNEFEKAIAAAGLENGSRSQAVQDLFVEYSRFLHRMNSREKLEDVILRRLQDLSPDYRGATENDAPPPTAFRFVDSFKQRLQNAIARLNQARQLHAEANKAFTEGDNRKAFKLHSEAAKHKFLDSIFTIGTYYQLGLGCDADMTRARKFYLDAAQKGHPASQQHYGALLQMGLGGDADVKTSVYWYRRAAAQNHIPALKNLAAVYASGLIGKTNYAASIATYLRAYRLGDTQSFDHVIYYLSLPIETF